MSGLITKDFIVLKNNSRFYLILLALYFVIGLFSDLSSFMIGMMAVLGISFVLSTFSYDEAAKWDQYSLSLAVTRREMVRAKYLVALLLTGIATVIGFVLSLIAQLIHNTVNLQENLFNLAGLFGGILLVCSLMLPFIYRFGVEKGRAAMILCILGVGGLIVLFCWLADQTPLMAILGKSPLLTALLAVALLCFFVYLSYSISLKIYRNKELS